MIFKSITKKQAEVKMYGLIGGWFANGDTFSQLLDDVEAKGHTELLIRLHCYGGSVFEGNLMFNAIQKSSLEISIEIEGVAASMGCFILSACDNVTIAENAFGMMHRPSGFVEGDADQLESQVKLLRDMESNFVAVLVKRTGKDAAEITSKYLNGRDNWLNATEMVELGLAKKIIPSIVKSIKDLDKEIVAKMDIENVYGRYAAVLENTNQNQKSIMNLALIISTFALEGLTAESGEAAVLAALKNKFQGLQTQLDTMQNEARLKAENTIKAVLDEAVTAGKIKAQAGQTIDQARAMYENIGKNSGVETLQAVLGSIVPTTPIAQRIVNEGTGASANAGVKNWNWYQEHDPMALEKMPAENPAQFKELYKAEYGSYPVL
ncbi:MAG: Clp protease ClpP [Bacteroidales bacterium]|nr:Clp protease ClpP [Bacteroidales bacterium]